MNFDVVVRVHAAGFTPGELDWPGTWTDRAGRDRTPSVPGHELSGVVVELGYGTTGLTVGQRVSGLTDWTPQRLPGRVHHRSAAATLVLFLERLRAGVTALIRREVF